MRYVSAWRVLAWLSSLSLLVVTGGAGWAAPAAVPPLTALTGRRTALIARIAELTDRSDRDQAAVVMAQQRRIRTGARLADARQATRDRARKAYMHGLGQTAEALARPNVYLEVSLRRDRRAVEALRAARTADDGANRLADSARDASRAALVELDRVRSELEATIGTRERMDASTREATAAKEAAARRRDVAAREAASSRAALPAAGHARATRSQQELLARYPAGPRKAIPAGLRPTGEVIAGTASWYGPGFDGRPTASGAIYDMEAWTCAHRTLPFGTLLLVSAHGRQVLVMVNDRGPYHADWVLDLSHAAAVALGHRLGPVSAEVLVPA
jgi:peptidoglycan lytic transglycosylase